MSSICAPIRMETAAVHARGWGGKHGGTLCLFECTRTGTGDMCERIQIGTRKLCGMVMVDCSGMFTSASSKCNIRL